VAIIDSIRVIFRFVASQDRQVYTMDIRNTFQNTIEFYPSRRTYSALPPFFVNYIRLRWASHPELASVEQNPSEFVIHNFCSMQGQKYDGQKFYQLVYKYMKHIGLKRIISGNVVFVWKEPSSELCLALAMDDCIVLCYDRAKFLDLKARREALFEVTLQEGALIHFLNLRIIQSPAGISIDQPDHIIEMIIDPYYKDQDMLSMLSITSPFPTD
jgi:hypothetical protein